MPSTATSLRGRIIDEVGNKVLQPPVGGLGKVFQHGSRTQRKIALTFDDGPNDPSTADVLDVLASYNVKATFFCVGINASRFPQLVKRAYDEGHIVGNHSMYHSRKSGLVLHEDAHIDECTETLRDILNVTPLLYRAPWGWLTPWETNRLMHRNFSIIGWDVYTYDWQIPSPPGEEIAEQAHHDTKPGSIILFHDGIAGIYEATKPTTVKAIAQLIPALQAEEYEFVTVPELLNIPAYN